MRLPIYQYTATVLLPDSPRARDVVVTWREHPYSSATCTSDNTVLPAVSTAVNTSQCEWWGRDDGRDSPDIGDSNIHFSSSMPFNRPRRLASLCLTMSARSHDKHCKSKHGR